MSKTSILTEDMTFMCCRTLFIVNGVKLLVVLEQDPSLLNGSLSSESVKSGASDGKFSK